MEKLAGVHPVLVEKIKRLIYACAELGHPVTVTDGLRSREKQKSLYDQGRTTPGKIVTNCDGFIKVSNHQVKADGYGHAVDVCFLKDGKPSWDEEHPWYLLGACAAALELAWGGNWVKPDRPHIEMP